MNWYLSLKRTLKEHTNIVTESGHGKSRKGQKMLLRDQKMLLENVIKRSENAIEMSDYAT